MAPRTKPDDRASLVELVRENINAHKQDTSSHILTNNELSEWMGTSYRTVRNILLSTLTEEEKQYRENTLRRMIGIRSVKRWKGIHALTYEQRVKIGRLAGKKSGKKSAEMGLGIHALTHEQRVENGRKNGKKSAEMKAGCHAMTREQRVKIGKDLAKNGIGIHALTYDQQVENGRKKAENGIGIHALTYEQRVQIGNDLVEKGIGIHALTHEQRVEIGKKSAEMGLGIHALTHEQRVENARKNGKKSAEMGVGIHALTHEQRVEIGKKAGRKVAEIIRRNSYFVENRFYAASQQEGAVALLLEKYFAGYNGTIEGINFQVKSKGISNGGIDFLVEGTFLEWHPIFLSSKRRGDIPQSETDSYHAVKSRLTKNEAKEFDAEYLNVLGVRYRTERQEAVDNSGHKFKRVVLARTVEDLYNFMIGQFHVMPCFSDFKSEFKSMVNYVKTFRVASAGSSACTEAA